jgi:hypothetical protein
MPSRTIASTSTSTRRLETFGDPVLVVLPVVLPLVVTHCLTGSLKASTGTCTVLVLVLALVLPVLRYLRSSTLV